MPALPATLTNAALQLGTSGDFLWLAIVFVGVAIVAGVAGFGGVAGLSMRAARLFVLVFLVLAVLALLL
jgi:uncharacterized membrane protein YtjA (UPF0391 family)